MCILYIALIEMAHQSLIYNDLVPAMVKVKNLAIETDTRIRRISVLSCRDIVYPAEIVNMTQRSINVSLTAMFFIDMEIRIVAHLKLLMNLPAKNLAQYAHLGRRILKIMKLNTAVGLQHHLH